MEKKLADKISKDFDMSDYRISEEDFKWLEKTYNGFMMDYFASEFSHRMVPYCGRYMSKGTERVDAFALDWSRGFGYFHPPVSEVFRVIEKAKAEKAKGILLVPDWPGSVVVAVVEAQEDKTLRWVCTRRMRFESPDWMESGVFRGRPEFGMRVYEMNVL